ncbi:unnamed protein product [Paramecium octaurelia]|uniref:Uncharacterized protein n=1 Tax=Paramecium octaurelia TaxID=43137 RepID=A0A8S1YPB9_PAROT|nr:unnamed protein product [Paramecium octaurelia]
MNCSIHHLNPISFICVAPHKCQCARKLCAECQFEHEVDKNHTVPINKFKEIVAKKLNESNLIDSSELTKQRMHFKQMLSSTLKMLKDIWDETTESIKQIYDLIEMEDKSYLNYMNYNVNPLELTNTELEKQVQSVIGKQLDDWNNQKNSQLKRLEMTKQYWEKETKVFCENQIKK